MQGCARADRAVHGDRAAERLDAVLEPDQAGAPAWISPAAAVVADAQAKGMVGRLHVDVNDGGVRVLGRIGQRFRDHVVGGDLHPLRQPRDTTDVELGRNRAAARERLQRRLEAAPGQDRGVAARQQAALPALVFHVGIDIGGTFTDCVLIGDPAEGGTATFRMAKALSTREGRRDA